MIRRKASLSLLAAAGLFGAGLGTARLLGWGPPPAPLPPPSAIPPPPVAVPTGPTDGGLRLVMPGEEGHDGGKEPRILFDPDKITLLPDASLKLDLPDGGPSL